MRIAILGNWHGGSNAAQYATAFERLGHTVTRVGPRFGPEQFDRGWTPSLQAMEWPPSYDELQRFRALVLLESPELEVVKEPGEWYRAPQGLDLILKFEAYGESPLLDATRLECPIAVVYGDTHTGHLAQYVEDAKGYDHVFIQFRPKDARAFMEGGARRTAHWLPAAADPRVWFHAPELPKDIDVLFVGSTDPHVHKDRVELLRFLKRELGEERVVVKHAFGTDAALLMNRAKVVLNRSLAGDLNMRVLETLCTGASLVTDLVDGLQDLALFARTYESLPRALVKVKAALNDLPDVGSRWWVVNNHTYERRAHQILRDVGLVT